MRRKKSESSIGIAWLPSLQYLEQVAPISRSEGRNVQSFHFQQYLVNVLVYLYYNLFDHTFQQYWFYSVHPQGDFEWKS